MTKAPTPEDPDAEKPVLEGATTFAPEALVAVRRRGKGLLLVGESGATYPVDGPLAALGTRRKPNEAMRSVAVGKAAMIGVTEDGRALHSLDDGNTWSSITLPPSQTIPLAVAGSVEGEVGLLAAPGRLLGSFDDGASFQPLKTSGLAAVELSVGADHHVWVSTMSPGGGKLGDGLTYLSERRARLTAAGLELGKSAPSRLAVAASSSATRARSFSRARLSDTSPERSDPRPIASRGERSSASSCTNQRRVSVCSSARAVHSVVSSTRGALRGRAVFVGVFRAAIVCPRFMRPPRAPRNRHRGQATSQPRLLRCATRGR